MTIDIKTVKKIASLSRIKLPKSDEKQVADDLSAILEWVGQLNEVEVEGVEPLANVNDNTLECRDDVVTDGKKADDILSNAPAKTAGFFTVPKVVE